jgi:ribosomal protein S18 acetylase RimI-like enzyme
MSNPPPESPPPVVTVRRVSAEEWKAFFELRLRFVENCPTAIFGDVGFMKSRPDSCWMTLASDMASSANAAAFLAWMGNQAIGFVTVSAAGPSSDFKIMMLYVDPAGRRFGLGRLLLMEALSFVRHKNATSVSLWVTDVNEDAKRLYEQTGFVDSGDRRMLKPGSDLIQLRMLYSL